MESIRSELFSKFRKVVIKVGTASLVSEKGIPRHSFLERLTDDISRLKNENYSVVLVSSGAVGLGMSAYGLTTKPRQLSLKQACAAVGQIQLMRHYWENFNRHAQNVAQVLLSAEDFQIRARYNNIRHTVNALLQNGVIPVINENDTLCTDELKVGDNDKLSSDVAHFLDADLLVMISDAGGLYDKNPKRHSDARFIAVVPEVSSQIRALGKGAGSSHSSGGMRSKLRAISQATEAGVTVILTGPEGKGIYEAVKGGEEGTLFLPNVNKVHRRDRWVAFVSRAKGKLYLDDGALRAVTEKRSSLLSAGILKVQGNFNSKELVELCSENGKVVGRGRSNYTSEEIGMIRGKKSSEVKAILGKNGPGEVMHRDNLFLFLRAK